MLELLGVDTRKPLIAIGAVSLLAIVFLVWLIYFNEAPEQSHSLAWMPALNASLNSLAAFSLVLGWLAIRQGQKERHRKLMLLAFGFSALFLVSYIIYHFFHGDTKFQGEGPIRTLYLAILFSHILLSVICLPMVLTTFFFSLSGRFESHRKIARFTLPAWLYVSVTGVVVFFMLKLFSASG